MTRRRQVWPRRTLPRRLLNRIAREKGWGSAFLPPWFVWLEPTQRCNLNCKVCARFYYGGKFHDIDPEVYDRVIREIVPGATTINLQGYGEPMLHPRFGEMLDLLEREGKRLSIICNGTLLTPQVQERMVKMGALVTLSVDGGSNETVKFVRARIDYDRILEILRTFHTLQTKKQNPAFDLWLNVVALRLSIEEIPSLIETVAPLGVSTITLSHFDTADRDDKFVEECLDRHPDLVRRTFPKIRDAATRCGIRVDLPVYECESLDRADENPAETRHTRRTGFTRKCFAPWLNTFVDVGGNVRPCCMGQAESMGNLKEQSFLEIWNGPRYRELRRRINTANPPEYCRRCPILFGINAGVPLQKIK